MGLDGMSEVDDRASEGQRAGVYGAGFAAGFVAGIGRGQGRGSKELKSLGGRQSVIEEDRGADYR